MCKNESKPLIYFIFVHNNAKSQLKAKYIVINQYTIQNRNRIQNRIEKFDVCMNLPITRGDQGTD
jgi:hypothetical protein